MQSSTSFPFRWSWPLTKKNTWHTSYREMKICRDCSVVATKLKGRALLLSVTPSLIQIMVCPPPQHHSLLNECGNPLWTKTTPELHLWSVTEGQEPILAFCWRAPEAPACLVLALLQLPSDMLSHANFSRRTGILHPLLFPSCHSWGHLHDPSSIVSFLAKRALCSFASPSLCHKPHIRPLTQVIPFLGVRLWPNSEFCLF